MKSLVSLLLLTATVITIAGCGKDGGSGSSAKKNDRYSIDEFDRVMSASQRTKMLLDQLPKAMRAKGYTDGQIRDIELEIRLRLDQGVSEDRKPSYICMQMQEAGIAPCVVDNNTSTDNGGPVDKAKAIVGRYLKSRGMSPLSAWNLKHDFCTLDDADKIKVAEELKELMK